MKRSTLPSNAEQSAALQLREAAIPALRTNPRRWASALQTQLPLIRTDVMATMPAECSGKSICEAAFTIAKKESVSHNLWTEQNAFLKALH